MTNFNRSFTHFLPNQFAFIQYSLLTLFEWNLGRALGQQRLVGFHFSWWSIQSGIWGWTVPCMVRSPRIDGIVPEALAGWNVLPRDRSCWWPWNGLSANDVGPAVAASQIQPGHSLLLWPGTSTYWTCFSFLKCRTHPRGDHILPTALS